MLGVIYGLKMGRKFFLGTQKPVQIWTNHKNLQNFRELQKLTGRQARWVTLMQDYNYVFKYIPRETNIVADLLSQWQDLNEGVSAEKQIMLPNSLFHIYKISPCTDDNNSLLIQKIFLKDDTTLQQQAL